MNDPTSIARAVAGCDVLLSGLGATRGSTAGTLTAGAKAVAASGIEHHDALTERRCP